MNVTSEQREKIDRVKTAVRAAQTPVERIAAYNMLEPGDIALEVAALHELQEETERCSTHRAFEADNCPGCGTSMRI